MPKSKTPKARKTTKPSGRVKARSAQTARRLAKRPKAGKTAAKQSAKPKPTQAAPKPPANTPPGAKFVAGTGQTKAWVATLPNGTKSLRLQRLIKAPQERIYAAFLDPDAYAKWLPPHGFVGKVHHMEPKVGGTFRMSFSTINKSWSHSFAGKYLELVPHSRIVHTDAFETDDVSQQGTMKVTIDLVKVAGGTEVNVLQEGIPAGPSADGAPYGWSQSLDLLTQMCEQELPF